ncbi:unnamed protein product [Rotaria sordida]|uniref:Uncharacterized protein n=1 Tax=Rotaria sordida TaxID=392033 RepID=A0A814DC71_9BILA|nr:unnamed protein product [Rotaria sordida]
MNFYITQYSSTYRPPRIREKSNILADKSLTTENLLTQKLKADRAKTGFVNNERYYLPYTRSLDEIDNPILGSSFSVFQIELERKKKINNYLYSNAGQYLPAGHANQHTLASEGPDQRFQ